MLDNIDRLFDREQQMYQIIGKTDQLNQEAFQFKKGAVTLKKNLFWKRVRCTCYIIIILLVCFINIYTENRLLLLVLLFLYAEVSNSRNVFHNRI